ncbi:hypothetical protein ABEB22_14275 (plasmid) [Thioclava sp. 'Guangxiensis']|uniref:hypothetical protein n=1 Tax=Thioclava sp. 'Guangxiensis' TaxID=3149044 RepID=UPI0032C43C40
MRKCVKIGTGVIAAAIVIAVGSIVAFTTKNPSIGVFLCSPCYGFKQTASNFYVERETPEEKIISFKEALDNATVQVKDVFGGIKAPTPKIFVCATKYCAKRIGMNPNGEKASVILAGRMMRVAPGGQSNTILSHELTHAELHHRVGISIMAQGLIPAWFDEGVAVAVSQDSRYLTLSKNGALHCLLEPGQNLPSDRDEWNKRAADGEHDLYARAACRVIRDLGVEDQPPRVLGDKLLRSLVNITSGQSLQMP